MQLRPVPNYVQGINEPSSKEQQWEFLLDIVDEEACYALSDILDANLSEEKLSKIFLQLIKMYPRDVDVLLQLSFHYEKENEPLLAYIHLQASVSIALQAIPNEFLWETGKINYNALNNRPFFRAYKALAEQYFETKNIEEAIIIAKRLISVHSDDNIGARYTLVKCYQHIKNTVALEELCKQYEGENLLETFT